MCMYDVQVPCASRAGRFFVLAQRRQQQPLRDGVEQRCEWREKTLKGCEKGRKRKKGNKEERSIWCSKINEKPVFPGKQLAVVAATFVAAVRLPVDSPAHPSQLIPSCMFACVCAPGRVRVPACMSFACTRVCMCAYARMRMCALCVCVCV